MIAGLQVSGDRDKPCGCPPGEHSGCALAEEEQDGHPGLRGNGGMLILGGPLALLSCAPAHHENWGGAPEWVPVVRDSF